jgi:hypothetical protein
LGDVWQGEQVTSVAKLMNIGNSPLLIEDLEAGCGCMNATIAAMSIPPGTATELTATFELSKPGLFKKSLVIQSNDRMQPAQRLFFVGNVRPRFNLAPNKITLTDLNQVGEVLVQEADSSRAVSINRVSATNANIKAEFSRSEHQHAWTVHISLQGRLDSLGTSEGVILWLDDPHVKHVVIPVSIERIGEGVGCISIR